MQAGVTGQGPLSYQLALAASTGGPALLHSSIQVPAAPAEHPQLARNVYVAPTPHCTRLKPEHPTAAFQAWMTELLAEAYRLAAAGGVSDKGTNSTQDCLRTYGVQACSPASRLASIQQQPGCWAAQCQPECQPLTVRSEHAPPGKVPLFTGAPSADAGGPGVMRSASTSAARVGTNVAASGLMGLRGQGSVAQPVPQHGECVKLGTPSIPWRTAC